MNSDKLQQLQIRSDDKERPRNALRVIILGVIGVSVAAAYFAWPRAGDSRRILAGAHGKTETLSTNAPVPANAAPPKIGGSVLTTSGYIVNRERIELSPRFMGVVKWIGVRKGDAVTNGQVVVLLDDAEYNARVKESAGRLANAQAGVSKAELDYDRILRLATNRVESKQTEDDSRLRLESARASLMEIEGQYELAKTYLSWTIIRSPINGVVLEKLVDPNELVVPQSFGGTRGPSTALISLADPKDLQVEIDLNEADLSKIFLNQKCQVSPEAYPEKVYEGYLAEIAPEANRQKGTLQLKVQIRNPDQFLTPELSAKVDFIGR